MNKMNIKEKIAEIRDSLLFIAEAIRGPVVGKAVKPLNFDVPNLTGFKENISIQSISTILQTAAAELDSLNLDAAEKELTRAQKKWAEIIKEQGRSKELTKMLNIIINLKQQIHDTKTNLAMGR